MVIIAFLRFLVREITMAELGPIPVQSESTPAVGLFTRRPAPSSAFAASAAAGSASPGGLLPKFAAVDQAGLVRSVKRKLKKIQYRPPQPEGHSPGLLGWRHSAGVADCGLRAAGCEEWIRIEFALDRSPR